MASLSYRCDLTGSFFCSNEFPRLSIHIGKGKALEMSVLGTYIFVSFLQITDRHFAGLLAKKGITLLTS